MARTLQYNMTRWTRLLLLLSTVVSETVGFVDYYFNSRTRQRQSNVVIFQTDKPKPYFVPGPPAETRPDYENIHGPMGKAVDDVFLAMFRTKLAEQVGVDSDKPLVRKRRFIISMALDRKAPDASRSLPFFLRRITVESWI